MSASEHHIEAPLAIRAGGGWALDTVVLSAPSGRSMLRLTVRAAAPRADAPAIAAQHAREIADRAPELAPGAERAIDGDVPVVAHRYRSNDGTSVTYLYVVRDGQARIAALAPDPDDATERAAAELVARADLRDVSRRVSVAYAPEELAVLAHLAGAASVPGVADLPDDDGEGARDTARRALLARGVVARGAGGRITIHPAHRELLAVVLDPRTVVSAEVRTRDRREVRLVYAGDTIGVAHAVTPDGVHVFATFPARELVAQALAAVALPAGPGGDERAPLTVDLAELERLEAIADHDETPRENGVPCPVGAGRLRVLRRVGERVEGGDLRWLDAGDSGLWSADVTDEGRALLTPITAGAIAERFARLAS